jgi:predicted O-methyltransferase YrrM
MDIVNKDIEKYIENHTRHLIPELEALERETYLKVLLPNMISGKEQGTFLYLFVKSLKPKRVLELGTFTGYSAICMAMGMEKGSELITIDPNEELEFIAKKYFEKCGVSDIIKPIKGKAFDYFDKISDESLDLIFIDADKRSYPEYVKQLKPKLRKGAFLLIDNVLWHGKIIEGNPNQDTQAILKTNQMLFEDRDFITTIIPIRDGILIAEKIN